MSKTTLTAKRITSLGDFTNAALFQLSDTGQYVIVSAVYAYSGPETLVFPATADGEVANWCEIGGGRGYEDHAIALEGMGYEVTS